MSLRSLHFRISLRGMLRFALFVSGCVSIALTDVIAAPAVRPNIVVILVDDHRWDDLGCMGHPFAKTPHIDRIAREGVKCLNAFVATPLCSPSRASFLTGQYASRHGILDNVARNKRSHELITFPRLLHDAGYATGFGQVAHGDGRLA